MTIVTRDAPAAPTDARRPVMARRDVWLGFGLALASFVAVLPDLLGGPGFYLDDWRNLSRIETVGWLRSAEAGKFASRPGAWSVETVLYPLLRSHATAWLIVLVLLNTAAAFALCLLLRRFMPDRVAIAVILVWILLPNRTSLKVFANTAPMTFGLTLLAIGIIVMDEDRLVWGALIASLGGLCYEVMLLPALTALVLVHLARGRGTRTDAVRGAAIIVITGLLMLIHPTYSVRGANRGTPAPVLPAHFSRGLSPVHGVSLVLGLVAAIGIVMGLVAFARGQREPGSGPWLIVAGLGVMAAGLVVFVLKWPDGYQGQARFVIDEWRRSWNGRTRPSTPARTSAFRKSSV